MSDAAWCALVLALAVTTLVLWALAMFTDTRVGRFYAAFGSHVKNRMAFLLVGSVAFIIGGIAVLTEPLLPEADTFRFIFCGLAVLLLAVGFVIDVFPIPLPRWMYPQWHAQRRLERRRAALAAASTATAPGPASTDPASRHDPHPEQHEQPPHKEPH